MLSPARVRLAADKKRCDVDWSHTPVPNWHFSWGAKFLVALTALVLSRGPSDETIYSSRAAARDGAGQPALMPAGSLLPAGYLNCQRTRPCGRCGLAAFQTQLCVRQLYFVVS
jgi:hypothetical protein